MIRKSKFRLCFLLFAIMWIMLLLKAPLMFALIFLAYSLIIASMVVFYNLLIAFLLSTWDFFKQLFGHTFSLKSLLKSLFFIVAGAFVFFVPATIGSNMLYYIFAPVGLKALVSIPSFALIAFTLVLSLDLAKTFKHLFEKYKSQKQSLN